MLITGVVSSQEYELGKVTIKELQEKVHPIDSSASAAILFKKGEVKIVYDKEKGFVLKKSVIKRVKIYKKEGYDYANQIVSYESDDNLKIINAFTYNIVNEKIEKTKLEKEGVFDEKVNKYMQRKKIIFPNIKLGSIIEFEFLLESDRIGNISEWYFQSKIPVNFSEYKTYIPEYFIYKPYYKGSITPHISSFSKQKTLTIVNKQNHPAIGTFTLQMSPNQETSRRASIYQETVTTYEVKNVPALKEELYINNLENYTSGISHELSIVKYPNSVPKSYSTDWESVVNTIYKFEDFGNELDKTNYFQDDVRLLTINLKENRAKVLAVLDYVKTKVKWNEYYGYWCNDGVKKAYEDNLGNVGEINLMLTSMLRYLGLNANPILVSTRSNGITILPSYSAYDYVISGVELDGEIVLLDATDKNSFLNILPIRDLNWHGQLIKKDGSSLPVDLMPKTNSRDYVTMMATIDAEGVVKGQVRRQLTDYNAFNYRSNYKGVKTDLIAEKTENEKGGIDITDFINENQEILDKPVLESYAFKDDKHSDVIGDRIYFSPLLFDVLTENPFKQPQREYPIDFSFPFTDKYIMSYQIPEGYEIESLPESINLQFGENIGAFKFNINKSQDKIQLIVQFDINTPIVPAEYYDGIKSFYQQMIEKQREKIVLKKI